MANNKIRGMVVFSKTKTEDSKNTVSILITPEQCLLLKDKAEVSDDLSKYKGTPLKFSDDGQEITFKTASQYDVKIYDDGEKTDKISLDDIGKNSEVELFFSIGETKYKGSKYQVAFLKSVNVLSLEEPTEYNPFGDESDTESF